MNPSHIESLFAKAVEGELNQEESEALLTACRENEALVKQLANLLAVDRLLPQSLEEDPGRFARELQRRMVSDRDLEDRESFAKGVVLRLQQQQRWRVWGPCAAVVAVFLSIASLYYLAREKTGDSLLHVASVVRTEATNWRPPDTGLVIGSKVEFGEGFIEIHYHKGVTVVLEAPASFEITGDSSGFLHQGKLVAEIDDERARGFVIDGVHGRLVDLGTKFGVSVKKDGEMEVHVLEGIVNATSNRDGSTTQLRENEAIRLGAIDSARLPQANREAFVTQLPPYGERPPKYVRWRFDEPSGTRFHNTGRDLAEAQAHADIKGGVERTAGYYGNAVHFNGTDAYLESDYRGIVGDGPRTVAFWVRVPEDFGEREGFGVVSWGSHDHEGAAWQISVNSFAPDGPMGRLRVGTNRGEVIGTTDLRDGQWHHCAVVLYGDLQARPNTSTHILLYVNGQLEPAALKSILAINTSRTIDHGVWVGRNLGFRTDGVSRGGEYGPFFRGDVDELIICDTALNQAQIRRLMTQNEMP